MDRINKNLFYQLIADRGQNAILRTRQGAFSPLINSSNDWPGNKILSPPIHDKEVIPPPNSTMNIVSLPYASIEQANTQKTTLPSQYQPMQTSIPPDQRKSSFKNLEDKSISFTGNSKRDMKERKKKRLEQNRLSARESRKRKKLYIESLEKKVVDLNEKLSKYKTRLDELMIIKSIVEYDKISKVTKGFDQQLQNFLSAINSGDQSKGKIELQKMFETYNESSDERNQIIEIYIKKIIDCMVPNYQISLIKLAQSGMEDFNPRVKTSKKKQIGFTTGNISTKQKTIMYECKEALNKFGEAMKNVIGEFLHAKNNINNEAEKLDTFIKENIIFKLDVKIVAEFFQWVKNSSSQMDYSLLEWYKNEYTQLNQCHPMNPDGIIIYNQLDKAMRIVMKK